MPTLRARAPEPLTLEQAIEVYLRLRTRWKEDPIGYCMHRLGLRPTLQQRATLEAIKVPGSKVTARSGHNTGKDAVTAGIILWFMETHTFPRVACTAPSGHQLYDILWGELAKWMRRADDLSAARGDYKRLWISSLFKLVQDRLYLHDAPQEWYAVARTARRENPEALAGLHASDVELDESGTRIARQGDASLLYVVDEASAVPDEVFETIEGALASPDCRLLMIGNPTRNTGYFAASHKQHRAEFTVLHFKTQDSPLADPGFRARLVRKFGEDSNVVRVRADGEFPRADDDALIPLEFCEAALQRRLADVPVPVGPRKLGIDVAWEGSDRTAFVCRQGHVVSHIAIYGKIEPMDVVGHALQHIRAWGVQEVYVDVIGVGSGVYSRLHEIAQQGGISARVYKVNVAEDAPYIEAPDVRAHRLRDYIWLAVRDWLRDEPVVFCAEKSLCDDLAGELGSIKLLPPDSEGRTRVEGKASMRSRGLLSPDISDALNCTFAPVAHHSIAFGQMRY